MTTRLGLRELVADGGWATVGIVLGIEVSPAVSAVYTQPQSGPLRPVICSDSSTRSSAGSQHCARAVGTISTAAMVGCPGKNRPQDRGPILPGAAFVGGATKRNSRWAPVSPERCEPELVADDQVVAEQGIDNLADGVIGLCPEEGFNQLGSGEVADLVPDLHGRDPRRDQHAQLSGAGRADQAGFLCGPDPLKRSQLVGCCLGDHFYLSVTIYHEK